MEDSKENSTRKDIYDVLHVYFKTCKVEATKSAEKFKEKKTSKSREEQEGDGMYP